MPWIIGKEDWHKEVRGITKEIAKRDGVSPGVDVIFEHIGGSHWNKELTLLKYGCNNRNHRCYDRI